VAIAELSPLLLRVWGVIYGGHEIRFLRAGMDSKVRRYVNWVVYGIGQGIYTLSYAVKTKTRKRM
jgi:hypothetical protein